MPWPADHPLHTDPALAPWAEAAEAAVPGAVCTRVLRYLEGRRVASLLESPRGWVVLKVFVRPRARGNDRRLRLLVASPVADLVPRPLYVDPTGHVSVVSWTAGEVYEQVDRDRFVAAANPIGRALRRLHESGAPLDRCWTYDDEVAQLWRRATPSTRSVVEEVIASTASLANEPLAPAHRDCHPRQVVLRGDRIAWIDLDDAALAPPALDVGNLIAHLRRDACLGRRDRAATEEAIAEVVEGYGSVSSGLEGWTRLALARLAGLAETRHSRPDDRNRLLELTVR